MYIPMSHHLGFCTATEPAAGRIAWLAQGLFPIPADGNRWCRQDGRSNDLSLALARDVVSTRSELAPAAAVRVLVALSLARSRL